MLGLDAYGSSDEDDESQKAVPIEVRSQEVLHDAPKFKITTNDSSVQKNNERDEAVLKTSSEGASREPLKPQATPVIPDVPIPIEAPADGPSLGPSIRPADTDIVGKALDSDPAILYSTSRAAIRSLTMPPVPNFAIPESPPGSPPLKATKKFDKFLELKKQGVHFNQKLESSSALANPTLFQKLMDYADLDEHSQYATTLPDDLAVPTKFPEWMYGDQLNKTQEEVKKKKEHERQGQPRQFVSGGNLEPASSSRTSTPGGSGRGQRQHLSTAERVMQGLERETRSPGSGHSGRRRE